MPTTKKESTSLEACLFIEKIFFDLNCLVFGSSIKKPDVKFSFSGHSSGLSFKDGVLYLDSKVFFLGSFDVVLATFHEMLHIINFEKRVSDVGVNSYHNKFFLKLGLDYGVFVIKHKTQGWQIISADYPRNVTNSKNLFCPSEVANAKIKRVFACIESSSNWKDFYSCRSLIGGKKEFTYKYICGCPAPHNSIRSGRGPHSPNPLDVSCNLCGHTFRCKSG
jgi:hypothetical protein